jgi:hypothetical protein
MIILLEQSCATWNCAVDLRADYSGPGVIFRHTAVLSGTGRSSFIVNPLPDCSHLSGSSLPSSSTRIPSAAFNDSIVTSSPCGVSMTGLRQLIGIF